MRHRATREGYREVSTGGVDWPRLVERATRALRAAFAARAMLRPSDVATCVCAALPTDLGTPLRRRLRELGWSRDDARLPADILDGPDCPPDLRDGRREVVRLALFGLPGQGRPTDIKHREAAFQQLSAQIMRESIDLPTLQAASNRALSHPDALEDPTLAGMLRSFVASREAALHVAAAERLGSVADKSQLHAAFTSTDESRRTEDLAGAVVQFERARLDFEKSAVHYDEPSAKAALERMQQIHERTGKMLSTATLQKCEAELQALHERCQVFRQQLDELAQQAIAAAQRGDSVTVSWALRRLSVIHALRPALLPDEHYQALRRQVEDADDEVDYREAACILVARERAIAEEIRALAVTIRRYHHAKRTRSFDDPEMRRIEAEYRKAVREIESHDTDWMAALVVELNALVEETHDTSGRMESKVDRFIMSVREALMKLRREIGQNPPPAAEEAP